MNELDLVRGINMIGEEHFSRRGGPFNNHLEYLGNCNELLINYLKEELKENFVFYGLTWMDKKNNYNFVPSGYNEQTSIKDKQYEFGNQTASAVREFLETEYLSAIDNGEIISMTVSTLSETPGPDLIFYSGQASEYSHPIKEESDNAKIQFFNLQDVRLIKGKDGVECDKKCIEKLKKGLKLSGEANQVKRLVYYYKKLEKLFYTTNTEKPFIIHFIRPYFVEFEYNLLLTLSTSRLLKSETLAFIDSILHMIVGLLSTKTIREHESLKNRQSFSLQTHSFKTSLNTNIRSVKNNLKEHIEDNYASDQHLNKWVDELDQGVELLYDLTGVSSLLDKADMRSEFIKSGIREGLLQKHPSSLRLQDVVNRFNSINEEKDNIIVNMQDDDLHRFFMFHDYYASDSLLNVFYLTLLENAESHGKPQKKTGLIKMDIESNLRELIFSNEMAQETFKPNNKGLTGNLKLFKVLFQTTSSAQLVIKPEDYKFRVKIELRG